MEYSEQYLYIDSSLCIAWKNIEAIEELSSMLHLHLQSGRTLILSDLCPEQKMEIFHAYKKTLGGKNRETKSMEVDDPKAKHELLAILKQLPNFKSASKMNHINTDSSIKTDVNKKETINPFSHIGYSSWLSSLNINQDAFHHNRLQSNTPKLSKEILRKIRSLSRHYLSDLPSSIQINPPNAHKDCYCLHCQIARAISEGIASNEMQVDEPIASTDLIFSKWLIEPFDKNQESFYLHNPQDPSESYHIYLKPKLSCSCQTSNCKHIAHVLRYC